MPGTGFTELSIPADYFETNYIIANKGNTGQNTTLTRTAAEQILDTNTSTTNTDLPRRFAYGSNRWLIDTPTSETTVTAYYYGFLPNLNTITSSTNTHWLINNADDLIVYWSAVEGALYYGSIDQTMIDLWEKRGTFIHDQIVEQDNRQKASGSTPKQRRPYTVGRGRGISIYNFS